MTGPKNVIGPRVRQLRREQGLSGGDLADRLAAVGSPLDMFALNAVESRTRRVKDTDVLALARALRVPIDDLFQSRARPPSGNYRDRSGG